MLKFGKEVRQKMAIGVNKLYDSTKITLGPRGTNAIIETNFGYPKILNDGVTIVDSIILEDKYEKMGADLIKEAAKKTNSIAGDGTTTTTILTSALINEGIKVIDHINPILLRDEMKSISIDCIKKTKSDSIKVDTPEMAGFVAANSSSDKELGDMVEKIYTELNLDAQIYLKTTDLPKSSIEIKPGMYFDTEILSNLFIPENGTKLEIQEPVVIVTDKTIYSIKDLASIFELYINENTGTINENFVLIAKEIKPQALEGIIINYGREIITCIPIIAPGFGKEIESNLKDIALKLNTKFISSQLGHEFNNIKKEDLNQCKTMILEKNGVLFDINENDKNSDDNKLKFNKRINSLKEMIKSGDLKPEEKKAIEEKIKMLTSGLGIIKIGAETRIELNEKILRAEDALNAVKAALKEGIVPGSGKEFLNLASYIIKKLDIATTDAKLFENENYKSLSVRKNAGLIFISVLPKIFNQICRNSGLEEKEIKDFKTIILNDGNRNYGLNAKTLELCDLFEKGIIDPVLVLTSSLANSTSIATSFLTTEVGYVRNDN